MTWLLAFALTQLIEVPIYLRALNFRRDRFFLAFGASALTHPIVWFIMPPLWRALSLDLPQPFRAVFYYAFLESVAIFGEALYFRLLNIRRPLLWSLLANGASFSIGLLVAAILGW